MHQWYLSSRDSCIFLKGCYSCCSILIMLELYLVFNAIHSSVSSYIDYRNVLSGNSEKWLN